MIRGYLTAALVVTLWGITFTLTRSLLASFSAFEIWILRYLMALVVLWPLEWFTARPVPVTKHPAPDTSRLSPWLFPLLGLTGCLSYQLLENCAIHYTNASNVAIIVGAAPIATALMGRVWGRDKSFGRWKVVGSLIAFAGILVVSGSNVLSLGRHPAGDLMAFGSVLSWALYSLLVERANAAGVPPLVAVRKTFAWALVLSLPIVLFGLTPVAKTALHGSLTINLGLSDNVARFLMPRNLLGLSFLGLGASALCFALWNYANRVLGLVKSAIALFLCTFVAVASAILFLHERVTASSMVGCVLILAGVALAQFVPARNPESVV